MSGSTARIAVELVGDTSGLAPAFREGLADAQRFVEQLKAETTAKLADINRALVAGLVTPQQAASAGAAVGREFTDALRKEMQAAKLEGVAAGPNGGGYLAGLNAELQTVQANGGGAATSLTALRRPLTALADSALGVAGPIGNIASRLGLMTLGGPIVVGVLAGVAAVAGAYRALTADAREAAEAQKKALDEAHADRVAAELTATDKLNVKINAAATRLAELTRQRDALRAQPIATTKPTGDLSEDPLVTAAAQNQSGRRAALAKVELDLAYERGHLQKLQADQEINSLAHVLSANVATNAERARAVALAKQLRDEIAKTEDAEDRAKLADQLKSLETPLTRDARKAATGAEHARRADIQQDHAFDQIDAAIARETPDKSDDFEAEIATLQKALELQKVAAADIDAKIAELRAAHATRLEQESASFVASIRAQLGDGIGQAITAAQRALNEFDLSIAKERASGHVFSDAQEAQLAAARTQHQVLADAANEAERLKTHLEAIKTSSDGPIQKMRAYVDELDKAQADVDRTKDGTVEHTKAVERLGVAQKAVAEQQHATKLTGDQIETTTHAIASHVADAASAAAGIVTAFAGANSEIAKTLVGVASIAHGVEGIAKAAHDAGGLGNLLKGVGADGVPLSGESLTKVIGSVGGVIAGGGAIIAALQGLGTHANAAEEAAQRALIAAQTQTVEQLRTLNTHLGSLALQNTQSANGQIGAVAADALVQYRAQVGVLTRAAEERRNAGEVALPGDDNPYVNFEPIAAAALRAAGLTFDEFKARAHAMGVEVTDLAHVTADDFGRVVEATRTASALFAQLSQQWDVLGTTAAEKFTQFLALLTTLPEDATQHTATVAKGLGQYDTASQEGRDAAIAYIRDAFRNGLISADVAKQLIDSVNGIGDDIAKASQAAAEKITAAFKAIADALDTIDLTRQIDGATADANTIRARVQAYAQGIPEGFREAFGHVFDGADFETDAGRATLKQKLQAYYHDVLLADGVLDDSEKQIAQGILSIIGNIDDLATSTSAAAEKLRTAGNQKLLDAAALTSTALHEDPRATFTRQVVAYAGLAPAFSDLTKGIDLATEAGLKAFTARLDALLLRLVAGDTTLDRGTLTLEEFTQAALGLESGAASAAQAVTSLAQTLSTTLSQAASDAKRLGTDPTQAQAGVFAKDPTVHGVIGGLDLSTDAGRRAALPLLRDAYNKGHDDALGQAIDFILAQPAPQFAAPQAPEQLPADTRQLGDAAQQLTEATGITLGDLLRSVEVIDRELLAVAHEQLAEQQAIAAILASLTPAALTPLTAPAYPVSEASARGPAMIVVHVTVPLPAGAEVSPAAAEAFGDVLGLSTARAINRAMIDPWHDTILGSGDNTRGLSP